MMKAKVVVVTEPGKLDIIEREIPQLQPEDMIVKIDMSEHQILLLKSFVSLRSQLRAFRYPQVVYQISLIYE